MENTMKKQDSRLRTLILAALFLALALVLPLLTGQNPQIGNMLSPMHLPVLLAGFICGPLYGLLVGLIAPLLRSLLFGMPPLFPTAVSMCFELAAYGLLTGLLWKKLPHTLLGIYGSLIPAMLIGRIVWGAVRLALAGLSGDSFGWSLFLAGAFVTAIPGIIIQLILVPLIVLALKKGNLIE